jgi:hypothetical protein
MRAGRRLLDLGVVSEPVRRLAVALVIMLVTMLLLLVLAAVAGRKAGHEPRPAASAAAVVRER